MIVIGFAWTIISIIVFLLAGSAHVPMPLLIVVAILCYCGPFVAIGPMYAVPPEIIAPDFFTNANGVILFFCNMFGIFNAILSGFLADVTGTYATGLIATCVFSVVGLVCAFVLNRRYRV